MRRWPGPPVPPNQIPASVEARAGHYRSMLADKRVLVLLDNARDVDQVRTLLPGTPGCLVLVTSRNQLTGLVAAEGAHPLSLDLFSEADARQLLADRLGSPRVDADAGAVDEIIARCARLPLALSIVAAHAATHAGTALRRIAIHLREGLDALDGGDPAADLRAVFSWSYHSLSAGAARLFRLLGLHPGPDVAIRAAASLAGIPVARVRPLLVELVRAHLVTEHAPGRYGLHDLLRAYATELTHTHDHEPPRRTATRRMLDHYLHTAYAADRLLFAVNRDPISLAPPDPGVTPEPFPDNEAAMAWFADELAVLLAAVDRAAADGSDIHAWQLAWAIAAFLGLRVQWREVAATQRTALAAARRLGDRPAEALIHRTLGRACVFLGAHFDAEAHLRRSLDMYSALGDRAGEARTHLAIATLLESRNQVAMAVSHVSRAIELCRATADESGQASALSNLGWYHTVLGDHSRAIATCVEALALHERTGNRLGQADTWDSLGYAHHQLGEHGEAIAYYQHAVGLFRELDDHYTEAETLRRLGDTHLATGTVDAARHAWRRALHLLEQLDHPDADQVRLGLHQLDHPPPEDRS